ncbi:MAG: ACT domain-containing protein [Bacteroidota bacterium]
MKVKQISIFLENKSGRLADVTKVLGDNDINIRALSIADTNDFGILRLIVNSPEKAWKVLKEQGFTVSETEIIAVRIPDQPGGLAGILNILENNRINIEYMYAFVGKSGTDAVVVFRVENIDRAIELLQKEGISLLSGKEIYEFSF